jgi:hypothetical protein
MVPSCSAPVAAVRALDEDESSRRLEDVKELDGIEHTQVVLVLV